MGSSQVAAMFFISMIFMAISLPPIYACAPCSQPHPPTYRPPTRPTHPKAPHPKPPSAKHPPHPPHPPHPKHPPVVYPPIIVNPPPVVYPPIIVNPPPVYTPPITNPPVVVMPPITNPPITNPPVVVLPPPGCGSCGGGGGGGGGGNVPVPPTPSPPTQATCPIDALKLGACVDVLGGLVHIGLGDPIQNQCCPVIQGLLSLEAAICLCTTIRLRLLNLNIFIPLALQVLITCGMTPPPGFTCPPLN